MDDRLIGYTPSGKAVWRIRGADDRPDSGAGAPEGSDDGAGGDPSAPGAADLSLTPAAIKNSPEYKELVKQNRALARATGTANQAAAAARAEAESARLAAEAREQAALEVEIATALGAEGRALWEQLAELSQSDQPAAARLLGQALAKARGQTPEQIAEAAAAASTKPGEGVNVPPGTARPPSGGIDGDTPLGAQAVNQTVEELTGALDHRYAEIVKRAQDPMTRNRVTMKERSEGMIAWLASAYTKRLGLGRER